MKLHESCLVRLCLQFDLMTWMYVLKTYPENTNKQAWKLAGIHSSNLGGVWMTYQHLMAIPSLIQVYKLTIGDVANSKRHQWMTEWNLDLIFNRTTSKLFSIKLLSCDVLAHDAILCVQHALVIIACTSFMQHTPGKSFRVNNFADFPDVWVRKFQVCPVVGGNWN